MTIKRGPINPLDAESCLLQSVDHLSAIAFNLMRKTLSFACLHFSVAFSLGWAVSGDWRVGGALAVIEPLCNTVMFYFHERFWQAHEQRRSPRDQTAAPSLAEKPPARRWHHC